MAAGKSGSFAVTTSNRYISGYVQWSETYDVAGNYSVVTATLRLSRTNTGYTTEGQSSFTLTINGNSNTETGYKYISYNSNTLCVSHSVTVPHEADGKKSIVISAEGYIYTNDLSLQSAQIELTVIPRASTLSAPNGTIGSYIMLTVNRASEAFTHTIEWSAGGKSGSLTNVGASVRWDITDYGICEGNTSGDLVPCNFTVYTYSGAELIGSSTASCTLTIPNDAYTRPDITVSDISVINSGNIASWREAVKGISKLRIGISASSGKYGASITSRKIISSDGQSAAGTTLEITPNTSGEYKFTATVTDSREFSSSVEKTINVYDYSAPVISSVDISRCTSDGTAFDEGTCIKIAASYSCTSINGKNTIASAAAYYRVSGSGNDYTPLGNIINGSVVLGSGQFDIGTSYDIKITVTDTVGKSDTYETAIGTAATEFNVGVNKVGVGKYAEKENTLEIAYDMEIKGKPLIDYIYPVGSIYLAYNHTSPAELFGGTWTRIENYFLWATTSGGTIGEAGGESTHTLTENEMPEHNHGAYYTSWGGGTKIAGWLSGGTAMAYEPIYAGGGAAHNNMPPYIQISAWRRTA